MFGKKKAEVVADTVNSESNENAISNKETEGLSQGQIVRRRFVRHRGAMVGLFTLITIILFTYSASGLHLGDEKNPISIPGWWPYSITDLPELRYGDVCPDGSTGCPSLDLNPFDVTPVGSLSSLEGDGSRVLASLNGVNTLKVGEQVVIAGVQPESFNGTFTIVEATEYDVTFESTSSGTPDDLSAATVGTYSFGLGQHPFGQDNIGRDYFALVMRGAEQSIMVMLIIGILGGVIGTVVGAVAGYFRGRIDGFLMRLVDLFTTIPVILIGAVIGFKVGNLGVAVLALFLGLFGWIGLARLVRGEFLSLREREFVDAARVAGASHRRIIFKHILPNAVGIIIVAVTLSMSGAILLETGLSYLGFGVVSPDVSLGSLISQYQDSFATRPWLFWWPGLFIISIALCINFIGDGLRDAFDPRQRRRISKKDRERAKLAAKEAA
jgi:ABC-type dipeptide/oligopeptide/nickel transport system permease subunit